jgi:colanic acid/amylovoran biosynthesis protein
VSHVYSRDNAGDAALLSVLLEDLRRAGFDEHIPILTMEPHPTGDTFDGYPLHPSFTLHALNRYKSRSLKALYSVYVLVWTTFYTSRSRCSGWRPPLGTELKEVVRRLEDTDVVIPVGGGYLRGKKGFTSTVELALLLHLLVISKMLGKPVILHSQSIGPFGNRLQAVMASKVLRRVDLIIAREDITTEILESLGVTANVVRSVDAGFVFQPAGTSDLRQRLNISDDSLVIGITVRQWLDKAGQDRYEQAVAEFADAMIDLHQAHVVFIPQVTSEYHNDDDRVASHRVASRMRRQALVVTAKHDHRATKVLYGGLNVLVGTRFHSVIFSLTSMVPALAIEYEHKTSGIMRDLGLDEWVLDIREVTGDKLIDRFESMLEHRSEYLEQLRDVLPGYQRRARQTMNRVAEVMAASGT